MLLELWDEFVHRVRSFYRKRGYTEVSTPILLPFPNLDAHIEPVAVEIRLRGERRTRWLQTSPEYSMKKLLSRYGRSIFQIAKVFRNNEYSRLHRVEFHMLEWYRVGADYRYLMEELKDLLGELMGYTGFGELTVEEAFRRCFGADLPLTEEGMREILLREGINFEEDEEWETLFYRAFLEVERDLRTEEPLFLTDFPETLCALAKVRDGRAERFELFVKGVELANGWTEETEREEVERRLRAEAERRKLPLDEGFLRAHESMPPCAGCSVGLDRLFMLFAGKESLGDVEFLRDEEL